MNRQFILATVLSLFCAHLGAAEGGAEIGGRAIDERKDAVGGAEVRVETPEGLVLAKTLTDASGAFRFRDLPEGALVVTVSLFGFEHSKGAHALRHSSPCETVRVLRVVEPERQPADSGVAERACAGDPGVD